MKNRLTVAAFRFAWWSGARIPNAIVKTVLIGFAQLMHRHNGRSVQRLTFSLSRVLEVAPESDAARLMTLRALKSYFRYWSELFGLERLLRAGVEKRVVILHAERVAEQLERRRGVLVVSTHSGNWDLAGIAAAHAFGGLTSVAERLEPVELFDLFVQHRVPHGIEILPHVGGAQPASQVLAERLRSGRLVALAADRDLSSRGIRVQLFGHQTSMPSGPARLVRETGAALVPGAVYFEGNCTVIDFLEPIATDGLDEAAITQAMADRFAEMLQRHPENWHMLQQMWFDHPVSWGGRAS